MADPYPYDPEMVQFVAWALTPPDPVCSCGEDDGESVECCSVCTELAKEAINAIDRWNARLYEQATSHPGRPSEDER